MGERESRVREGGSRAGGSLLWRRTDRCQYRILKSISELGGACREPLSVWRRAWETLIVPSGWIRAPPVPYNSVGAQLRSLQLRTTKEQCAGTGGHTTYLRRLRARHALRGRAGRRWPAAPRLLRTCSVDVSGMPARLRAFAMRSPKHRRAARAVDIACSTRCQELLRLTWSSPRFDNACRLHAPGNAACRRFELPWGSPTPGTACLLRAPRNAPCRQRQTSGSPRAGTACPRRARCSAACGTSAADFAQPSFWQRLPPPCAMQYCVSPRGALVQPSCWQRLPPPCAMQCCVYSLTSWGEG